MNNRTINLTNKNIRDFAAGDTLYVRKLERGFLTDYLVKFVSFSRGIVKGEVVESEGGDVRDGTITARLNRCYLWGAHEIQAWRNCCHWFGKSGVVKTYEVNEQ